MTLSDLLARQNIDPRHVLVMRHRPSDEKFAKVLPWLAAEKPDFFNAYQQVQTPKVERAMPAAKYLASFIGHARAQALFVGLYTVGDTHPLSHDQFWNVPANVELKALGMKGLSEDRDSCLWFDLAVQDFYADWKGKLIVGWPPPERSWWRWAHRNTFPIVAILEESALDRVMPPWDEINLTWDQLSVLPTRWRDALSQWRGIYFIFDASDGKGYVGSAYGIENLFGRWRNYGTTGHGGNRLLRQRDPRNFSFSILQRLSPDMDADDVVRVETTWKNRLHTHAPHGLNDN